MTKGTHDNDNERFSFITLAAATANVTRYLVKEDQKPEKHERSPDHHSGKSKKDAPDKERAYIEHRLRELAAWERRISGKR